MRPGDREDALHDAVAYVLGKPADPADAAARVVGACLFMAHRYRRRRRGERAAAAQADVRSGEARDALEAHAEVEAEARAKRRAASVLRLVLRCPVRHVAELVRAAANGVSVADTAGRLGIGERAAYLTLRRVRAWVIAAEKRERRHGQG